MQYPYVLFDQDGTLFDSQPGITRCAAYALEAFGIHVEDLNSLRCFIGPPLPDSFQEYYGFTPQQAQAATGKYRERYNTVGLFENALYPGIPALLDELRGQGRRLIVATSKPTPTTLKILEHFGILDRFDLVVGSEFDGTRGTKSQVIRDALEMGGVTDKSRAMMIGDRKHDVLGAAENGIPCLGVLYGFGSRQELEAAGAFDIVETVEALADWFRADA